MGIGFLHYIPQLLSKIPRISPFLVSSFKGFIWILFSILLMRPVWFPAVAPVLAESWPEA
jgi:hypothetical protein